MTVYANLEAFKNEIAGAVHEAGFHVTRIDVANQHLSGCTAVVSMEIEVLFNGEIRDRELLTFVNLENVKAMKRRDLSP